MKPAVPITAIVPQLPPVTDSLGDYSLWLASQLWRDSGQITSFVVGDPSWQSNLPSKFPVQTVASRTSPALVKLLPQEAEATVLLHYMGYGYARRGCPSWLIEGLYAWRLAAPGRRLITIFHDLYDRSLPWTSAVWTSPLQRHLARRLMNISDRCLTSQHNSFSLIESLDTPIEQEVSTLPIFSTVGEPRHLLPLADRPRRLVVFGSQESRQRVYQRSRLALEQTCQDWQIEEICDVGPDLDFQPGLVNELPVIRLGIRQPREISNLLAASLLGFFDCPTSHLEQSTTFAAYCAHRLLPVGVVSPPTPLELEPGKHYWQAGETTRTTLSLAQTIADQAHAWYHTHNLAAHARLLATCLD